MAQPNNEEESRVRLDKAKDENKRLRAMVEKMCSGLGDVQDLWGKGLPIPVSSTTKAEEMQRKAMEDMADYLERLRLSSKLTFSDEIRQVMADWIGATRSKPVQQCHKMVRILFVE